eukprot:512852-Pelagomonas_calceolata.AAC.1
MELEREGRGLPRCEPAAAPPPPPDSEADPSGGTSMCCRAVKCCSRGSLAVALLPVPPKLPLG